MPLFRKKKDAASANQGAPAIPGLNLPSNQSILSLAGTHNFGLSDVQSRTAPEQGQAPTSPSKIANGGPTAVAPADGKKFGTVNDIAAVQQTTHSSAAGQQGPPNEQYGHRSTPSSLSRSTSSGAVPYHLPWTRQLREQETATGDAPPLTQSQGPVATPAQATDSITSRLKTPPRRKAGDAAVQQSSSVYSVSSLPGLYSPSIDFRTSPSTVLQPSPSQRRQVIDSARHQSLKRSKAPSELNIMVVGAQGTGKTSFIRALLATCDLSLCTDEVKLAASQFGVASDTRHPTYDTDPVTPLRTAQVSVLSGVDLHPSSLIPIAVLESGASFNGPDVLRPHSLFSSSRVSSSTSGQSSGRVQLSICDTPGIDFEIEDEFEVDRKIGAYVRHIEQRLQKTLQEETKVQRSQRGGSHIHLVLYFIDPRFMLERIEARKTRRDRARYAFARSAAAQSSKEEEKRRSAQSDSGKRLRSTSLSHHAAARLNGGVVPAAAGNGGLSKQAQTAQLCESMDAIQLAKLFAAGTPAMRADSADEANLSRPATAEGVAGAEWDEQGVEPLTKQQLSALARLSERANVLPVVAKADTLTHAQLEEVKAAIRDSIVRANIDLGAFEVDGMRRKKKAAYESYRPGHYSDSLARTTRDDVISPVGDSSEDRTLTASPVKVIRIKTRRSYSATGERVPASTSGHSSSMLGHDNDAGAEDGQSTLGHTNPLFDGSPAVDEEEDVDDVLPPEALAKMMPFALFVPEPVRIRNRQGQGRVFASGAGPQRKGSMNSIAEQLPPVPPLPRQLSNIKQHRAQQSSVSTVSDMDFVTADQSEAQEVLSPRLPDSPTDTPSIGQMAAMTVQDPVVSKRNSQASVDSNLAAPSRPPPPPPPASRRFRRDFRYGHANVLDARHCDFALLRTCILGSHVDQLRESTVLKYERFRQQKLELSRLTRQVSTSALPTGSATTPGQ